MLGAIFGDITGSIYEHSNIKTTDFIFFNEHSRFTDDTVMTIATMDALLGNIGFPEAYRKWYARYPDAGYGSLFKKWAEDPKMLGYNSFGNGSAMRVSPVGLWYKTLEDTLRVARESAIASHDHSEAIKGAQAIAASIFLAREKKDKIYIKEYIAGHFGYMLTESVESIRNWYRFDVSCQGSVPQAITCFLESTDFEDAIRKSISIGGDSDTIGCMTGAIAEAYYGIDEVLVDQLKGKLTNEMILILDEFYERRWSHE
ncbi:MAG: ADP-ribosylglycohydrolase family protein [Eubacteriales bacterium]